MVGNILINCCCISLLLHLTNVSHSNSLFTLTLLTFPTLRDGALHTGLDEDASTETEITSSGAIFHTGKLPINTHPPTHSRPIHTHFTPTLFTPTLFTHTLFIHTLFTHTLCYISSGAIFHTGKIALPIHTSLHPTSQSTLSTHPLNAHTLNSPTQTTHSQVLSQVCLDWH